ncbi:DUF2530 domain-containing protein [Streptomyces avidinii]|uniref:DUF2530 domain-containing protein n=1 Tax=Streptomyces avidinii TaxID=1895 RepID=A0ABS4LDZ0_STRAV|nr:DUF2530 domain-containing protein [Streptomyces avidinii]MBP2040343.1 hypothetical protein [Streptomyces avidinii]GGZ26461.1 hypothetical protein GCM10010343_62130 [Streptomyces avidinii]
MAKWTAKHEAPEPLEGPVVATVTGGTILWFALFLVQLPFYGWFADRGQLWWVWTCAAGGFLGLIGIWYVRGRDAALKRHAAEAEAAAQAERDGQAGQAGQDGLPGQPGQAGTEPQA